MLVGFDSRKKRGEPPQLPPPQPPQAAEWQWSQIHGFITNTLSHRTKKSHAFHRRHSGTNSGLWITKTIVIRKPEFHSCHGDLMWPIGQVSCMTSQDKQRKKKKKKKKIYLSCFGISKNASEAKHGVSKWCWWY